MRLYPENVSIGAESVIGAGRHFVTDHTGVVIELNATVTPMMVKGALVGFRDVECDDEAEWTTWLQKGLQISRTVAIPELQCKTGECSACSFATISGYIDVHAQFATVGMLEEGVLATPFGIATVNKGVMLPQGIHPYQVYLRCSTSSSPIVLQGQASLLTPAAPPPRSAQKPLSAQSSSMQITGDVIEGSERFLSRGWFIRNGALYPDVILEDTFCVSVWLIAQECGQEDIANGLGGVTVDGCPSASAVAKFGSAYIIYAPQCGFFVVDASNGNLFLSPGSFPVPHAYMFLSIAVQDGVVERVYYGHKDEVVAPTGTLSGSDMALDLAHSDGFFCKGIHVGSVQMFKQALVDDEMRYTITGGAHG